jgi:hypothetical protein
MAKLDDVSWHLESAGLPEATAESRSATHMGFFLLWAVRSELWNGLREHDTRAEVERLKRGEITGAEVINNHFDGKLLSEIFTAEGAAFAESYYPKQYLKRFQEIVKRSGFEEYHVPDTAQVFALVSCAIDADRSDRNKKPWWRLW